MDGATETMTRSYEEMRQAYRPDELQVLLIGESPPDPNLGELRFFYSPKLHIDNLYRGVVEALYGKEPWLDVTQKPALLRRLQLDGYWLIDAVDHPINRMSAGSRREEIKRAVPGLVRRCQELNPRRGVILCHSVVYRLAAEVLAHSGVTILQDQSIPFPLGNWRHQFVERFRRAVDIE